MFMTTMPPTSSEMIPQIMKVMSYILLFCSLRRQVGHAREDLEVLHAVLAQQDAIHLRPPLPGDA